VQNSKPIVPQKIVRKDGKLRKFTGESRYFVLVVWCTNVKNPDQIKFGHDLVGLYT